MRKSVVLSALCASLLLTGCFSNDDGIQRVLSYGFVDLEGAKTSAIIVEYGQDLKADAVSAEDFEIIDYTIWQEQENGYERTIETDKDGTPGNEGQITYVYVNNEPQPASDRVSRDGHYVIIEVNTDYILTGQNLVYTTTMMAGVRQLHSIKGQKSTIPATEEMLTNYTVEEREGFGGRMQQVINTDKANILLPELSEAYGWSIHRIGDGAFQATHCYSEYTGEYVDFELPYSIYVPSKEVLEANKGKIGLTIHMEHAGANDTDPMAAVTSSRAAVKHASPLVQSTHPTIVLVPQIEESRRSTNDLVASSEANTAIWELVDHILDTYKGYIDENRIYGTGQSMGGMTILNMAAQRDNFFAGVVATGAQWSNSYNKTFQNGGERTPDNDPISFNGWGLDRDNYQNWYYMVSDDNILVQTCKGDAMATGLWLALADYYEAAGVKIPYDEWSPFDDLQVQNQRGAAVVSHENSSPGSGISWVGFTDGSHMSTWKYGYQLDYCFDWLYAQNRSTEMQREKVKQLRNEWLGRDSRGKIRAGSGTNHLNSGQYTPGGADAIYEEGWTPVSATIRLIDAIPETETVQPEGQRGPNRRLSRAEQIEQAKAAYNKLSENEKEQVTNAKKILAE